MSWNVTKRSALLVLQVAALCALGCEPKPEASPPAPAPTVPQTTATPLGSPTPSSSPTPPSSPEAWTKPALSPYQPPAELAKQDEEPVLPAEGGAWGVGERRGGGLPKGISVRFEHASYTLTQAEAAAGVTFRYRVEVSEPIEGLIPRNQTSAGPSKVAPDELLALPMVEGQGRRYARVDGGRGPMVTYEARTVPVFSKERELRWEGKSWSGPSCTNEPLGPAFPPGVYRFKVRIKGSRVAGDGSRPYRVEWSVPVTIKP
jgi:hypothetical protein